MLIKSTSLPCSKSTSMPAQPPLLYEFRRILIDTSPDALASPASSYLTGWSHGKEALKPGVYDTQKGSFYVNCAFYQATDFSKIPHPLATSFPEQTTPNLWPDESVLPGYRETFEAICTLIIDTAVLVAKACDRYAEARINGYQRGYLERVVRDSVITKARLLHYFARTSIGQQADGKDDDWCATHVDHGCLTGLTSAMYIDEGAVPPVRHASGANESSLPPLPALPGPSDSTTGLYIHARDSSIVKVLIPADQLAFQTGEALQLITNGKFRAVPHFVKGDRGCGSDTKVTRNTLAVFTQPNLGDVVDAEKGLTFGQFTREVISRF